MRTTPTTSASSRPAFSVWPCPQILSDLGAAPDPGTHPSDVALWVTALINPIPGLGVAVEVIHSPPVHTKPRLSHGDAVALHSASSSPLFRSLRPVSEPITASTRHLPFPSCRPSSVPIPHESPHHHPPPHSPHAFPPPSQAHRSRPRHIPHGEVCPVRPTSTAT